MTTSEEIKAPEPEQPPEAEPVPAPEETPPDAEAGAAETTRRLVGDLVDQILRSKAVAGDREVLYLHIDASSSGNTFTAPVRVAGDVVSGGQAKPGRSRGAPEPARPRSAAGRVDREQLRKVLDVHVAVSGYARAERILDSRGVVLLQGPPGMGKRTSALHLLMAGKVDPVLEIAPNLELAELLAFDFEPGGRYLVDAVGPGHLARITPAEMEGIGERVLACGGRLAITVRDPAGAVTGGADAAVREFVVGWEARPDGVRMLVSHLRWLLAGAVPASDPETICADEAVAGRLAALRSPHEVDRIARVLVRWARGEIDRDDACRRLPVQAAQEVVDWFRGEAGVRPGPTLADCARLITVAVLNGASHRAFAAAADELHEALFQRERGTRAVLERSVFGATREELLERVRAAVVGGYERTHFGLSPIDVVQFEDESWQPAVIRHVWREYDLGRGNTVAWLRELGRHPAFDVRVRVARAVGELADLDFGEVCDEVLQPWATDEDADARETAADALGVAAHGEAAPLVLNLLSHWATVDQRRLQWTAAAAFGGPAGLRFPNLALDRLEAILAVVTEPGLEALAARAEDVRLVDVVNRSIRTLFERGREVPAYYREVLRALVGWSERPPPSAMGIVAVFIFLNLALGRLALGRPARPAGPGAGEWPDLLRMMADDREARELALDLWAACFEARSTREEAMSVLGRWLALAGGPDGLGEALESAMLDIGGALPEYDRVRLGPHLARATRGDARSPAAERLLRMLSEGS